MRAKTFLVVFCCAVLGLGLCSTSYAEGKVGFINLQRLVNESRMGKAARRDILKLRKEREVAVTKKLEQATRLKELINKNGSTKLKNTTVKDLMVPLSEYVTVPEGSTLYEAVQALDKAREEHAYNRYRHRAVLILDKQGRVIGKLSQLDVLRGIEPNREEMEKLEDIRRYGFSRNFINRLQEDRRLESGIVEVMGKDAAGLKVEDFMQAPSEGEYVEENTSLDTAIHQLVKGTHLSLLVTRDKEIVGILRMSDVFVAVARTMIQNGLPE